MSEDIRPIVDRLCSTQDQETFDQSPSQADNLAGLSQSIWDFFQRNKECFPFWFVSFAEIVVLPQRTMWRAM